LVPGLFCRLLARMISARITPDPIIE